MKVLYDYQAFTQKIGGVSRYHIELIKHLSKEVDVILPPLFSKNIYLSEINSKKWDPLSFINLNLKDNLYKGLNQLIDISYLERGKYDLFHPTFLNPYYNNYIKNRPIVVTVHDLIHEKYPDLIVNAKIVQEKRRKQLKKADAIICISKQTKDDLQRFYDIEEDKIHVVYHGANQNKIIDNNEPIFKVPYLLFVGGRNGYKNFPKFLEAFSTTNNDIHLVCTGKPFSAIEKNLITKLKIQNRIHHILATEKQMENLFHNSIAFIYPSLCEGFGLPILEAFRCNCPCIISDIKCFHEVANNAAFYFNPHNTESISYAINKVLQDSCLRQEMKLKGMKQLTHFTWDKCAKETEGIYNLVL